MFEKYVTVAHPCSTLHCFFFLATATLGGRFLVRFFGFCYSEEERGEWKEREGNEKEIKEKKRKVE